MCPTIRGEKKNTHTQSQKCKPGFIKKCTIIIGNKLLVTNTDFRQIHD